jgi:NTE family protein
MNDAFSWLQGDPIYTDRKSQEFDITQLLDLPDPLRELMLEINRSEPVNRAQLSRALDRNPAELEIQINQLMTRGWLDIEEDESGEWAYRVRITRRSKRVLPPDVWQILDGHWQTPIFRLLADASLEEFSRRFQLEQLKEGMVLFESGEWGEQMYIVDSGEIELLVQNEKGEPFVVRKVGPGGIFGEMSILLGEYRPYTARVVEKAKAWTLTKTDLDYLLAQHPAVGLTVRRELARKTKSPSRAKRQHNPVVAVGDSGGELARHLAEQTSDSVVLIDLVGKRPAHLNNLTYIDGRSMRSKAIAETAQTHVQNRAWVIVASLPQITDQLMRVTALAEVVIDLTGSGAPWLRAAARRYWSTPFSTPLPLSRLARKLCGRVTGFVLSGGAARTIAHFGVLDVLQEEGIQLDVIAGCGYGALSGVLYAAGWPPEKRVELAMERMSKLRPFSGWLGLRPTAKQGMFDARSVRNLLRNAVQDLEFSDLETPCHLVTSDFTTGETVWIDRGRLFSVLSACVATPGLVTPIEYQDRLLVDATLSNPLPADVAVAHGADVVLASSVIPVPGARQKQDRKRHERDLVTSWFNVCDIVAHNRSLDHLGSIDLIIAPNVAEFPDTAFAQAESLIERGRQAAKEALPQIRSLLRSTLDEKDSDRR